MISITNDQGILRSSEFKSQLRYFIQTLIRSEVETTVMDALQIAQFRANEQFRTATKDLVAHELNEVFTTNPKLAGLQDDVGTLFSDRRSRRQNLQ